MALLHITRLWLMALTRVTAVLDCSRYTVFVAPSIALVALPIRRQIEQHWKIEVTKIICGVIRQQLRVNWAAPDKHWVHVLQYVFVTGSDNVIRKCLYYSVQIYKPVNLEGMTHNLSVRLRHLYRQSLLLWSDLHLWCPEKLGQTEQSKRNHLADRYVP